MNLRVFKIDQVRAFALEVYGPRDTGELIWKVESDLPLAIPARGERLQLRDARGARDDLFHEITAIEQVMWENYNRVCAVTRVFTRPVCAGDQRTKSPARR